MKGSVDLIQTGVNLSLLKVRRNWSDSGSPLWSSHPSPGRSRHNFKYPSRTLAIPPSPSLIGFATAKSISIILGTARSVCSESCEYSVAGV